MGMKCSVGTFLVLLLVGCGQAPPAYESKFPQFGLASFIDTFDDPEESWDLRGPYAGSFPLPAATDGFFEHGVYSYAGNAVVYAVRQFTGRVTAIGTRGQWRRVRDGDAETAMTMALTSNDKIVSDMVHFSVSRSRWSLTVRRGADFISVAEGRFAPQLSLDRAYRFELATDSNSVAVQLPDDDLTPKVVITDVDTVGLVGDRAFWEEFPVTTPASMVFDFDTVWGLEEGQPVKAVS